MAHVAARRVRRRYTLAMSGISIGTAECELWSFFNGNSLGSWIRRISLRQTNLAVQVEESIAVRVIRGYSVSPGTVGGITTIGRLNSTDPDVAPSTVGYRYTTLASGGTPVTVFDDAWNLKEPYDIVFAPDESPYVSENDGYCVLRLGARSAAITVRATVVIEQGER